MNIGFRAAHCTACGPWQPPEPWNSQDPESTAHQQVPGIAKLKQQLAHGRDVPFQPPFHRGPQLLGVADRCHGSHGLLWPTSHQRRLIDALLADGGAEYPIDIASRFLPEPAACEVSGLSTDNDEKLALEVILAEVSHVAHYGQSPRGAFGLEEGTSPMACVTNLETAVHNSSTGVDSWI